MPTFTPPTQQQGAATGDSLFDRYTVPVGLSVVRTNGVFTTTPYPWLGDLVDLTEGSDFFLGVAPTSSRTTWRRNCRLLAMRQGRNQWRSSIRRSGTGTTILIGVSRPRSSGCVTKLRP